MEKKFFFNPGFSSYVNYALEVPMLFIVRDNQLIEVKNSADLIKINGTSKNPIINASSDSFPDIPMVRKKPTRNKSFKLACFRNLFIIIRHF